jgi:hypothetical protein
MWREYLKAERRRLTSDLNKQRVHAKIMLDLLQLELDHCPVSTPTRELPAVNRTVTMETIPHAESHR